MFIFEDDLDAAALERSLARALDANPIFAGRLRSIRDTLHIDCNNAGAGFAVYAVQGSGARAVEDVCIANRARFVDELRPNRCVDRDTPLLRVRVNQYRGGGTSLGLCWHHSVGDLATFMNLMRAWSRAFNGDAPEPFLDADDRPAYVESRLPDNGQTVPGLRYVAAAELAKLAGYMLFRAPFKRDLQFHFAGRELDALRREFAREQGAPVSINSALCAHMFCSIASEHGWQRSRSLSLAVDIRKRIGLPVTLHGNMLSAVNLSCEPGRSPASIAAELTRHVGAYAERFDYYSTVRFVEQHGGTAQAKRFVATALDPIAGNCTFSSWAHFGVYDLAFGAARPAYFGSLWNLPFPWLATIVEAPGGDGLTVNIGLPRKLAQAMSSERAQRALHRFRKPDEPMPAAIGKAWPRLT